MHVIADGYEALLFCLFRDVQSLLGELSAQNKFPSTTY